MVPRQVQLKHTTLQLLPEKAVYLPEFNALCIADWHLGKAAHFRKAGIPLPQPDLSSEFSKVSNLIEQFNVQKVILLGDVFHSKLNNDWQLFEQFIAGHSVLEWIITMGNHDIIGKEKFQSLGILATDEFALGENVVCSHHPMENVPEQIVNLAGHIHPGCEIYTAARQRYRLPCFHYSQSVLTLPAFGSLTGLYILKADEQNRIFAIIGDEVKELKPA